MFHAGSVMALISRENERNCFIKVADGTGSRRASARMCDIERETVQNYARPVQQVYRQQEALAERKIGLSLQCQAGLVAPWSNKRLCLFYKLYQGPTVIILWHQSGVKMTIIHSFLLLWIILDRSIDAAFIICLSTSRRPAHSHTQSGWVKAQKPDKIDTCVGSKITLLPSSAKQRIFFFPWV